MEAASESMTAVDGHVSASKGPRGKERGTAEQRAKPLIPIGEVVTRLRNQYPDITHSSLRFLEREGLITASRTPGGHRLYSTNDLQRIRQIKAWQAQGLSLAEIRHRLAQLDRLPPASLLSDQFLAHALAGDFASATSTILSLDDVGFPLGQLFGDVLRPALVTIGKRWEDGALLIAQEKEISELARDLIAELTIRHSKMPAEGPAIVAACVRGEFHELGLLMICGLLRAGGRRVYYLGPDVDAVFLLDAVRLHQPSIVLLSAKMPPNLAAVKTTTTVLVNGLAPHPTPAILVGGQAAAEHPDLVRSWRATPIIEDHPETACQAIALILDAPGTAVTSPSTA